MELAEENAKMVLDKDRERIKREEGRTIGAVHEVEEWLGLSGIKRMEAYDISNISGFESVGSMVVYEKESRNEVITVNLKSNGCRDRMIMQVWKRCLPDALPMKEKTSLTVFHYAGSDFNGWWKRTGKYCVESTGRIRD